MAAGSNEVSIRVLDVVGSASEAEKTTFSAARQMPA